MKKYLAWLDVLYKLRSPCQEKPILANFLRYYLLGYIIINTSITLLKSIILLA